MMDDWFEWMFFVIIVIFPIFFVWMVFIDASNEHEFRMACVESDATICQGVVK